MPADPISRNGLRPNLSASIAASGTNSVNAAMLMVLLRMIQGVSVGGEYTSSFVFLVEHAPPHRRAFFGSWSMIGATC
ncbi:MAG: MFS transporter, partial [Planctomycetota bacterium]